MGIDYGAFPMEDGRLPNRNPQTGIRYGIARRDDLADWVHEEAEPQYVQGCGWCGDVWAEDYNPEFPYTCHCGETMQDEDESWSEEPVAWTLETDGVVGQFDETGDLWVFGSPVGALGVHCSPCAPGACMISPDGDGDVHCYGLPAEFWRKESTS